MATINSMQMGPVSKYRMQIPLCKMVYMPMVRPTLESDLKKLKQEFVHGYREGSCVFYVALRMNLVKNALLLKRTSVHGALCGINSLTCSIHLLTLIQTLLT